MSTAEAEPCSHRRIALTNPPKPGSTCLWVCLVCGRQGFGLVEAVPVGYDEDEPGGLTFTDQRDE